MEIPQGLNIDKPNHVCKLNKSLYGLKQASRQWFAKLSSFLLSLHYNQSHHDHSLFTKHHGTRFTVILIYVDDLIIVGTDSDEINHIKQSLDVKFKIKDLGPLRYFLILEIARSHLGISLSQQKYTLDLLDETGFLPGKPVLTPIIKATRLSHTTDSPYKDPAGYRRLIGKLLYLTTTRPDISYFVQQLSQFLSCPQQSHYQAAIRVLKYLKGNPRQGLFYLADSPLQLKAFTDSNWASCPDTRRSLSSYSVS
uniref:Retrovirus-related Pol polyprotein from transposon TNT 1-94 n=1 Tax=Cajanus cajan TaxID=3821 RepID=A0A151QRY2_CAJCA|nr:Retrovirus-related Pol polyprotein from transposon TNT 1-94 [Cajanus cajan]